MPFRRVKTTHLITAVDIVLIVAAATAIVMALGVRDR